MSRPARARPHCAHSSTPPRLRAQIEIPLAEDDQTIDQAKRMLHIAGIAIEAPTHE